VEFSKGPVSAGPALVQLSFSGASFRSFPPHRWNQITPSLPPQSCANSLLLPRLIVHTCEQPRLPQSRLCPRQRRVRSFALATVSCPNQTLTQLLLVVDASTYACTAESREIRGHCGKTVKLNNPKQDAQRWRSRTKRTLYIAFE